MTHPGFSAAALRASFQWCPFCHKVPRKPVETGAHKRCLDRYKKLMARVFGPGPAIQDIATTSPRPPARTMLWPTRMKGSP